MRNSLTLIFILFTVPLVAQDNLMDILDKENEPTTEYTVQTFKGTRLVNGQTVETKGKKEIEFIFAHRFGSVNGGAYELFGLDQAYVRYGLEYGITSRLGVGVGRNSFDKTTDGYFRYKALRQSKGRVAMPITVTFFGNTAYRASPKKADVTSDIEPVDRLSYTAQLIIARKFTSNLSLQLMPSFVHKNTVDKTIENNDMFILGIGGRIKVSRSVAITSEYYHRFNIRDNNPYYNSIGVGVDIETGGHVFQIVLTNTQGLTERAFLTETTGQVSNGDIHLGFNITRTF